MFSFYLLMQRKKMTMCFFPSKKYWHISEALIFPYFATLKIVLIIFNYNIAYRIKFRKTIYE